MHHSLHISSNTFFAQFYNFLPISITQVKHRDIRPRIKKSGSRSQRYPQRSNKIDKICLVKRERKRKTIKMLFEDTRTRSGVPLISWTTKTRLLGLLQPIPLERSLVNTIPCLYIISLVILQTL